MWSRRALRDSVQIWKTVRMRPRCHWSNLVRHIKRKFNRECDELSGRGRLAEMGKLHVNNRRDCQSLGQYWKGSWDGGYDPGKQHVGLRWNNWNGCTLQRNNARCSVTTMEFGLQQVGRWFARAKAPWLVKVQSLLRLWLFNALWCA